MSVLSQALKSIETQIAEGLITGVLTNNIAAGLTTFISATPNATLPEAQAYINAQLNTLLANTIKQLPGWEQAIANVLVAIGGESALQGWIDTQVAWAYNQVVQKIAGTAAGKQIVAEQVDAGNAGEAISTAASTPTYATPTFQAAA
jgi:hypothetical protein